VSGSIASHIVREEDGTSTGLWAPFVLKSAFQPIFAFEAGKLSASAFEALVRPFRDGAPFTPASFLNGLPVAERIVVENLLYTLHLKNAAACLPQDAAIFINLDPSVFIGHAVADAAIRQMRVTLAETGIEPRRVVCEVTEKETVSQESLYNLVASLRANGFRVAVDDFGADGSDMERIHGLHPDLVKFDGEWIKTLMGSGPGYGLLAAMVSRFADQGIRTVFEGMEEGWQVELAEKAGVTMVQGFVLARPELAPGNFVALGQPVEPSLHQVDSPSMPRTAPVPRAVGELRHTKAFGRRMQPS